MTNISGIHVEFYNIINFEFNIRNICQKNNVIRFLSYNIILTHTNR